MFPCFFSPPFLWLWHPKAGSLLPCLQCCVGVDICRALSAAREHLETPLNRELVGSEGRCKMFRNQKIHVGQVLDGVLPSKNACICVYHTCIHPSIEESNKSCNVAFLYSMYFPTCQVRVVRFYVSCPPPPLPPLPLPPRPPPPPSAPRCLSVASMWCAGPQPRPCEFSVACRTSTAILWVQCGVPDLNRDPVSSV